MLTKCRPHSRARALLSLLIASALTASLWVTPSAASRKLAWSSLERSDAARAAGPALAPDAPRESAAATEARAREAYGKLGLSFEANHGQTDERVRFITRAGGATVFLTQTEAVFLLRNAECGLRNERQSESPALAGGSARHNPRSGICNPQSAALRMKFEGANEAARVEGVERLPGIVNYFIGNDPEKWRANIPTFGRVSYAGIYAGIDLVYYGTAERQLEYDFVVQPGADSSQVSLQFEGADSVTVEAET